MRLSPSEIARGGEFVRVRPSLELKRVELSPYALFLVARNAVQWPTSDYLYGLSLCMKLRKHRILRAMERAQPRERRRREVLNRDMNPSNLKKKGIVVRSY
jgi:hypothetical protein